MAGCSSARPGPTPVRGDGGSFVTARSLVRSLARSLPFASLASLVSLPLLLRPVTRTWNLMFLYCSVSTLNLHAETYVRRATPKKKEKQRSWKDAACSRATHIHDKESAHHRDLQKTNSPDGGDRLEDLVRVVLQSVQNRRLARVVQPWITTGGGNDGVMGNGRMHAYAPGPKACHSQR